MLWPNYLRPVPAMTLIEYTPDMDKSSVPGHAPQRQFTTNAGEIRVDEVLPSDAKGGAASLQFHPLPGYLAAARCPSALSKIEIRSTTGNWVMTLPFRSHRERTSARWI